MPSYSYICPNCGAKRNKRSSIADRNNTVICDECKDIMKRDFGTPFNFKVSNRPFDFGKGMDAEKERKQILERTGGY